MSPNLGSKLLPQFSLSQNGYLKVRVLMNQEGDSINQEGKTLALCEHAHSPDEAQRARSARARGTQGMGHGNESDFHWGDAKHSRVEFTAAPPQTDNPVGQIADHHSADRVIDDADIPGIGSPLIPSQRDVVLCLDHSPHPGQTPRHTGLEKTARLLGMDDVHPFATADSVESHNTRKIKPGAKGDRVVAIPCSTQAVRELTGWGGHQESIPLMIKTIHDIQQILLYPTVYPCPVNNQNGTLTPLVHGRIIAHSQQRCQSQRKCPDSS
jgi:hypothetical protein